MTREYQELIKLAKAMQNSGNEDDIFECWARMDLFLKEWESVPLGEDGVAIIEQVLFDKNALADKYMHLIQVKRH